MVGGARPEVVVVAGGGMQVPALGAVSGSQLAVAGVVQLAVVGGVQPAALPAWQDKAGTACVGATPSPGTLVAANKASVVVGGAQLLLLGA